jgi:adenylosuccinate synthase
MELRPFIGSVSRLANDYIDDGRKVLIEGSQGLGLSLHHGPFPYVTSRDTSPGALCGEVGVSPLLVTDVLLVLRTYPIRVTGNSGPLPGELSWEDVTNESGSDEPLVEYTTVTQGVRRVARFDWSVVEESVRIARPTQIVLNFVDYIEAKDFGLREEKCLSKASAAFVNEIERNLRTPVTLIGTGPGVDHVIDRVSSSLSGSREPALTRMA